MKKVSDYLKYSRKTAVGLFIFLVIQQAGFLPLWEDVYKGLSTEDELDLLTA